MVSWKMYVHATPDDQYVVSSYERERYRASVH